MVNSQSFEKRQLRSYLASGVLRSIRFHFRFYRRYDTGLRTDDRGIAELEWSNDNDLKCLYIKGERYDGPFESGRSCTIVVD